jgi:cyclopropane-fatty-acyl-phospholipid synthase
MFFKISDLISEVLNSAVTMNGPLASDPQIKSNDFYRKIANSGLQGFGDSYVDGDWDCLDLPNFFYRTCRAGLIEKLMGSIPMKMLQMRYRIYNPQATGRAGLNASAHYGIGNDLFGAMLDDQMTYTCAIWRNPFDWNDGESLLTAQERKIDLANEDIDLDDGMEVLDVGSGWGSYVGHTVERSYKNVKVTGITPVLEQVEYATKRYKHLPVKFLQTEFQKMPRRRFDRIVSFGAFEHFGVKNYDEYFNFAADCLRDDGKMFLHFFGRENPRLPPNEPWIEREIFPGVYLSTYEEFMIPLQRKFNTLHVKEVGFQYPKTLVHWQRKFNEAWPQLQPRYGDEFKRKWDYYLGFAAGIFKARKLQLWQITAAKKGSEVLYFPLR